MKKKNFNFFNTIFIAISFWFYFFPTKAFAFPIYAQQNYENPREPNGKIVCANCHLAQKPIELETPKSILPNTIFESVVTIPIKKETKQLLGNGMLGDLNIGAVLILPEQFKLAPKERLSESLQQKLKNTYITPYSSSLENILVVGPLSSKNTEKITFPILAPDPEANKKIYYLKYPIYAGGNRGRGQLYPNGEKTNNNSILSLSNGIVNQIKKGEKGTEILVKQESGDYQTQIIPKNMEIIVKENQKISQDQPLTANPNMGGFGQTEAEIVLQNPERIYYYTLFCFIIVLTQTIFVLKKKQFEKVQLAEMDF